MTGMQRPLDNLNQELTIDFVPDLDCNAFDEPPGVISAPIETAIDVRLQPASNRQKEAGNHQGGPNNRNRGLLGCNGREGALKDRQAN